MLAEVYEECVRAALASSKSAQKARDLAHEVLLAAMERGVEDLSAPERRAWLRGAIRKHAAFEARTAVRRASREARWHASHEPKARSARPWRFAPEVLAQLSPAVRVLAALASAELAPREIRSVLRLSDTAFRKRVSELRRALRDATQAGSELVVDVPTDGSFEEMGFGKTRTELLAALKQRGGWTIASHDPDGHPIIFSNARPHKRSPAGNSS